MSKTAFLDRDGVINACAREHDYIKSWGEFRLLNGAVEGIRALNEAGYQIVVVTNQRGVAHGIMTAKAVDEIHARMCRELQKRGARIDAVFVCPHDDGECGCRKPKAGLFLQAEKVLSVDKEASWMVGDSESDVAAGALYGVKTILLGSGGNADRFGKDLMDASKIIIESERQKCWC